MRKQYSTALTHVIPQESHIITTKFGASAVTVPPV